MGNHEYCEDCGASCFHYEGQCNPIDKAHIDREKRKQAEFELLGRRLAIALVDKLKSENIPAELSYGGDVQIRWSSLARQYKEEHADAGDL